MNKHILAISRSVGQDIHEAGYLRIFCEALKMWELKFQNLKTTKIVQDMTSSCIDIVEINQLQSNILLTMTTRLLISTSLLYVNYTLYSWVSSKKTYVKTPCLFTFN